MNTESIRKDIEKFGYEKDHPDHELLVQLIMTAKGIQKASKSQEWADNKLHRINIRVYGRTFCFSVRPEVEYYLREAAKILNQ